MEGLPPLEHTWKSLLERREELGGIEKLREVYASYPRVKAYREARLNDVFGFFTGPDDLPDTEEEFVRRQRNSALTPFALLWEGAWYERGEMGWFGCVQGEKDQDDWNAEFSRLWDEIPDDEWVTVVDCHV